MRGHHILSPHFLDYPLRAGPRPGTLIGGQDVSESAESIAFLDGTYEEVLKLTREARDYLAVQESADLAKLPPEARLIASCETMRLTSRLAQVMVWLLVQKAVHAGDMARAAALEARFRLAGQNICAEADALVVDYLPAGLARLMAASHALYSRVARLDALLDGDKDA